MGCSTSTHTSAVDTSRPSAKPEEMNGATVTEAAGENGNVAEDSETIPDQTPAPGGDANPADEPVAAAASMESTTEAAPAGTELQDAAAASATDTAAPAEAPPTDTAATPAEALPTETPAEAPPTETPVEAPPTETPVEALLTETSAEAPPTETPVEALSTETAAREASAAEGGPIGTSTASD